jgi:hypothetical protein
MKYLLLLALTFVTKQSFCQTQWINVGSTRDNEAEYISASCVHTSDPTIIQLWVKEENTTFDFHDHHYIGVTAMYFYSFDFSDNTMRPEQAVFYSNSGKLISSMQFEDYEKKWASVIPGSVGELFLLSAKRIFYPVSTN